MTHQLRSPIPPQRPPSFAKSVSKTIRYTALILFIIVVWGASSLIVAPIVQWGINQFDNWVERSIALRQEATLVNLKLSIPCEAFENTPPGCDGMEIEGETVYGASSVLYFWGRMPELRGIGPRDRNRGNLPDATTDGVFYTLQKAFRAPPVDDAAMALAYEEVGRYGTAAERRLANGIVLVESSGAPGGNFYAVYPRDDGKRVAAACFGDTCKVVQAPWRDELAYGFTIARRNMQELTAIDAAVRRRIDGFVVE